jgi:arylsulfatase A-like enzyme
MMKRILVLLSALTVCMALQAADRPNVVIIYADDMGYGDLGVNNPESKIPTPHLDTLASEGMRFTDGHSSSGICTPSRFAMLTGQHHWRRFHNIVGAMGGTKFEPDDFTLGKMFQSKGYTTACIGKWHLGWDWEALLKPGIEQETYTDHRGRTKPLYKPADYDWTKPIPDGPCAQGFDYYFGDGTINFPPYCWVENDRVTEVPTKMVSEAGFKSLEGSMEFREGPMVEGWDPYKVLPTLTDKAAEWIGKQSADKPFFLYFALPSPHAPIIPNREFHGSSEAGYYGDFVVETDAMAGRIIDALKEKGFWDRTVVVFTSDNGPERYAFDRMQKYDHWSAGELRGLKRDVWEGGHRVPFIIKWPGRTAPGSVSDETINQVDLYATFAKAVGYELKPAEAIDSYDLSPVLDGVALDKPLRFATVQNTYDRAFALRKGDWLYIDAKSGEHSKASGWYNEQRGYKEETTPGVLYNLARDPGQRVNLYTEYPEKVKEMKTLLDQYRNGQGCAPHAK